MMRPDFGSIVFNLVGASPFRIRVLQAEHLALEVLKDRFAFHFPIILLAISQYEDRPVPISTALENTMITLEVPCRRPSNEVCDRWLKEVLLQKEIAVRADVSRQYVAETGESVIPLVAFEELPVQPVTTSDTERLAKAQQKRNRKKNLLLSK